MSNLSQVDGYINDLISTGEQANIAHAHHILGLMDVEQPFETFKERCVLIPMVLRHGRFGLSDEKDRAIVQDIIGAEDPRGRRLPPAESEGKTFEMLDVAHTAFSQGDQPLMPVMMLGKAQWLIFYRTEAFEVIGEAGSTPAQGRHNAPLGLSLIAAHGDPAQWMFTYLIAQDLDEKSARGGAAY